VAVSRLADLRFCNTADCEMVYFGDTDDRQFKTMNRLLTNAPSCPKYSDDVQQNRKLLESPSRARASSVSNASSVTVPTLRPMAPHSGQTVVGDGAASSVIGAPPPYRARSMLVGSEPLTDNEASPIVFLR
jgi:hypothetical protein